MENFGLQVGAGEKVLLAGPSGSGKSTLLRALAGLLRTADVGDLSGEVRVDGMYPQARPGQVGLLLQDPSAATVSDRVGRDVAFGIENTGVPREKMPDIVRAALRAARFPYGETRRTAALSGGETQRLSLAGALALGPRVLLLDEPTSMLDAENAARVRAAVLEVCAERGTTLVVVEHRLEPWLDHVDRLVVLDEGRVVGDGLPRPVMERAAGSLAARGIWVSGLPAPQPMTVEPDLVVPHELPSDAGALVRGRGLSVRHRSPFAGSSRRDPGHHVLHGVDADLEQGRSLVLSGPSGAGKSTLLAVLAGLQRPASGSAAIHWSLAGRNGVELSRLSSAELASRLAWAPQLPAHGLVQHTVLDEVLLTSTALGRPLDKAEERARALLAALGLDHLMLASAHRLSGGEQRRLLVAAALVHGPAGLLLDEPTVGQDRLTWAAVTGACTALVGSGGAVAVATHDPDARAILEGGGATGRTMVMGLGDDTAGAA